MLEVEEKKTAEAHSCLDRIWYSLNCSARFDRVIILENSSPFFLFLLFLLFSVTIDRVLLEKRKEDGRSRRDSGLRPTVTPKRFQIRAFRYRNGGFGNLPKKKGPGETVPRSGKIKNREPNSNRAKLVYTWFDFNLRKSEPKKLGSVP